MQTLPLEGRTLEQVVGALGRVPLFASLGAEQLARVAARLALWQAEPGETIVAEGQASDAFFLVLAGEARVLLRGRGDEPIEVGRLRPGDGFGEIGLLLDQPRSATVAACERAHVVRLAAADFLALGQQLPAFGMAIARALAGRLRSSQSVPLASEAAATPAPDVLALLPIEFVQRQRVLPLRVEGQVLILGFVGDPSPAALAAVRGQLPGLELRAVRIDAATFEEALRARPPAGAGATGQMRAAPARSGGSPRLDKLLARMVAEGASDLHLSGGQRPRWRIDGDICELADLPPLGADEAYELLAPVIDPRARDQFADGSDADFAYPLPAVARFRVNLFRDHRGAGAVLRQIPDRILGVEQLGLPPTVLKLCDHPKGLVLVTGPTGSGKSTTLAAMIDHINRTRPTHVITLEDPIEFVHPSRRALVNQREVGAHTRSFARALKAALREDPDIVLVGEMRDLETVALALEIANTGHLVFGTLHTATAITTVDRIIDVFPAEQQAQVRSVLGEVLRGVIAQTLCKKTGGGRVAALEILVVNPAIANLIREGKTIQVPSLMQTGKAQGNLLLNDELARLVGEGKVAFDEALSKALDKGDLARRVGRPLPA